MGLQAASPHMSDDEKGMPNLESIIPEGGLPAWLPGSIVERINELNGAMMSDYGRLGLYTEDPREWFGKSSDEIPGHQELIDGAITPWLYDEGSRPLVGFVRDYLDWQERQLGTGFVLVTDTDKALDTAVNGLTAPGRNARKGYRDAAAELAGVLAKLPKNEPQDSQGKLAYEDGLVTLLKLYEEKTRYIWANLQFQIDVATSTVAGLPQKLPDAGVGPTVEAH